MSSDFIEPTALERQVAELERDPEVVLVSCRQSIIATGTVVALQVTHELPAEVIFDALRSGRFGSVPARLCRPLGEPVVTTDLSAAALAARPENADIPVVILVSCAGDSLIKW